MKLSALSLGIVALGLSFLGIAGQVKAQEAAVTTTTTTAPTASEIRERQGEYERAVVASVTAGNQETAAGGEQVRIYTVRFLSGPLKGQTREIRSGVNSNPYQIDPKAGDTVVIFMQPSAEEGGWSLYLEGFDRRTALFMLFGLFFLTLVLLSGWQGAKVVVGIIFSLLLIGFVLIPLFLRGVNPVPTAIILSGVITLVATGLASGWNRKALIVSAGTMGGALVAYILSLIFVEASHLSGLSTEEDRMFFRDNPNLNPRGLLFAGIILAAVGAAEDVAASVVSSAAEVRRANPRVTFKELFGASMTVGKDHMAALSNTLIFAYVGASLSALLLYTQFDGSWLKFINFDIVVDEIIRSLAATIGIAFTVPVTALLAAWYIRRGGTDTSPDSHVGHRH